MHGLGDEAGVETDGEGDLPGLEGLHPHCRLHIDPHDRVRVVGRDLLDVGSPGGRRHHHHPLSGTIEHESEIDLALARDCRLHIEPVHALAPPVRLVGDEPLAQQLVGGLPDLTLMAADPYAARLPAGPGVDLGLHHPLLAPRSRRPGRWPAPGCRPARPSGMATP